MVKLRFRRFFCCSQSLLIEILIRFQMSLYHRLRVQWFFVSEDGCVSMLPSYPHGGSPFPGYPRGRALCVCRPARGVQPESQGDLPHSRLSTLNRVGAPVPDAVLGQDPSHRKSKTYNPRTREPPGLDSAVFHI